MPCLPAKLLNRITCLVDNVLRTKIIEVIQGSFLPYINKTSFQQVTMNPDGTIAGAHGINLTDSSGRIIPVSLSLSLPISSFGNSLTTSSQTEESIVTSEAVAAASAVNEIFTNQQSETSIDVQLSSGQVITEQIENADVIAPQDEHAGLCISVS